MEAEIQLDEEDNKHWHACPRCNHPFQDECDDPDTKEKYCHKCLKDKQTPTEKELIASYPELSEDEAKLIFIRQSATEAYEKGEIKEATKTCLKTIVEIATIGTMSKDEISAHIGHLEQAKSYLAAFTQGLMIGVKNEVEPKFREKHKKEEAEAAKKRAAEKTKGSAEVKRINDILEMAKNASLNSDGSLSVKKVENTGPIAGKVRCDKCGKEVYSLKYHKC